MLISPSDVREGFGGARVESPEVLQKAFDAKHNHYVNVSNQYKENGTRTVPQERRRDFSDTIRGE